MKRYKPGGVLLGLALAWASATLVGCAGLEPPSDDDSDDGGGQIGVSLELASSAVLYYATYTITGPDSFSRSVTVNVGDTSRLAALIGNIPPGLGYVVSVSGVATDGVSTCKGTSAPFDVTSGATTMVNLRLECREPSRTGSIQIEGIANFCPVVDIVAASQSQATVGQPIGLTGSAHDANNAPSPLSYLWTATSGSISGPSTQNPMFTCTDVGDVTIVLTVTDGDCSDTGSLSVFCVTAPPPAAP
jgi:hypothetical protein